MAAAKSNITSITTPSGRVNEGFTKNETKTGCFCLGYRHLVAFYSFFYFSMINSHIPALSISMVAMVNHSLVVQANMVQTLNDTALSCPDLEVSEPHTSKNKKLDGSFNWDTQTQGAIMGLSTLGYLLSNCFAGRIGEIFGAKRTLLVADLFLNICTLISPVVAFWSEYALLIVQIARGFFQGFILPCVFIMMANWFPKRERGLLSSFAACGTSFGNCVSGLVIGKLCDTPSMGWPTAFYVVGGFDLTVTLTYLFFFYENPKLHPSISKVELEYIIGDQENDMSLKRPPAPWKAIFTSIPVYALTIGKFGFYWSIAHFVYMHPTFLGTVLHLSMTENGFFTSLLFAIMTISSIISMTVSFWLRQKNILSVNSLRKGNSSLSAFGFSLCLVGVLFAGCDTTLNMVFCCLAISFAGIGMCGTIIVNGDMSPKFSGSLAGITSAVSCMAYTFVPLIVGRITEHESLGEWHTVFYMHIAVITTCGIIFQVFGSAEIQPFDSVTAAPDEKNSPGTQLQSVGQPDSNNLQTLHM